MRLAESDYDYYQKCINAYNLIKDTVLVDTLTDLRDKTITRLGKLSEMHEIHQEQGKLQILNYLLNYKSFLSKEVQRMEGEIKDAAQD